MKTKLYHMTAVCEGVTMKHTAQSTIRVNPDDPRSLPSEIKATLAELERLYLAPFRLEHLEEVSENV